MRKLTSSEDLLARLEALGAQKGPRQTLVELGAGVWVNAKMSAVDLWLVGRLAEIIVPIQIP